MFDAVEVGQKLSKAAYAERETALRVALINAQYDLKATRSPVVVMIAGDDRPGSAEVLNVLHEWMDSRFLDTHAFGPESERERTRPRFWRYWTSLPPRGRVGVYLGGWALSALAARLQREIKRGAYQRWLERLRDLERCLAADGAVFVKLWMHLPKREHEKRLKKAGKSRGDAWRVDEVDWRICDAYDALIPIAAEFLKRTSIAEAPWHIVEASDERHRNVAAAERILEGLGKAIALPPRPEGSRPSPASAAPPERNVLDRVDLNATQPEGEYKEKLEELQLKLRKLAGRAEEAGLRTLLVFEGWDAAGKGGVIRRLTHALDVRDYKVIPIAAPSAAEQQYHYLWRFWRQVPEAGRMVVFDRSWYGRVLVERVEGFASGEEWRRAYSEINRFEQELAESETMILKFWLHIDPDEQLRRFREREKTPYKKYKISEEDYRNRDQWNAYVAAVHDMVERTSTPAAPWHLVPANDKRFARIQVLDTVCDAFKDALKK